MPAVEPVTSARWPLNDVVMLPLLQILPIQKTPCAGIRRAPACAASPALRSVPAGQHQLADRRARLETTMRLAQIRRVDRTQRLADRRVQFAAIDEICRAREDFVLAGDVGCAEHRAREHELP